MTPNEDYTFAQRMAIILRCVLNSCPRCAKGPISKPFAFPERCPHCDLVYDRGNGFLLSALPAVYFMFALFWAVPLLIVFLRGSLSFEWAMGLVAAGAVVIPLLLFNYCKMLALALYYFFLPRELYRPAEWDELKQ